MKNLLVALCFCMACISFAQAQNNPGFSYQAVARDANGMIMANQQLGLRLSIIQDNTGAGNGTVLYREHHQPNTNTYGLFTLVVGKGTATLGDFQQIDWAQMNLFLQVDIDVNLDQTYSFMGKTRILPVPVALHAMSVDDVDDADADPTNEIQFLQYDSLNNTLQLTGANAIKLSINGKGEDADADPQNEIQVLSKNGVNVTLSEGGGTVSVADNDNNPNNELQSLSRVGNQISLSNGGGSFVDETQDADADATNEIQVIGFDASTGVLTLSNGGGQVDLSVLKSTDGGIGTGTDDQQLTLNGTVLSIEDGNSIDLANLPKNDADADAQNELQQLTFDTATYILRLSDGGEVDLSTLKSFGTGGTTQNLNLNGTTLGITGGNTVDLSNLPDQVNDADADPSNEIQAISFDTVTNLLTLSNGGMVDLSILKNEEASVVPQNLNLNGTLLEISDGNSVDLLGLPDQVDDADADPTNEIQAISFDTTSNMLTLSNGGTVDLTSLKASTGNTVFQNLSLNGTTLSISGGNQIDLSILPDQVNDADADPNNELQMLSYDDLTNTIILSDGGFVNLSTLKDADGDAQNELQQLTLDTSTNTIQLSQNGGLLDLSYLRNNGNSSNKQTLQLKGNNLSISDGNTVSLDSLSSPWEIKNGFIEYTKNRTKVKELFAQSGDTVVSLNKDALLFDEVPDVFGDETIVDHQGFRSFETLTEYTQLTADSLYFTYAPDLVANFRDVRSSSFTPEKLSIEDSLEVAKLSTSGLQFDFSENTGDYAYYGHDSLSFAYNFNFLLPFFSNMDATKLEFWSVGGESKHYAAYSDYFIAEDTLTIDAFGLVNKGSSANTPYERFRLEANDFTMRNDARWKTFDFTTPFEANAATFNMYPGTGLPEYFTLGPSPSDPLSAQLTMQTDGSQSVCLAGHNGAGELCLLNQGRLGFSMMASGIGGGPSLAMMDTVGLAAMTLFIDQNNDPVFNLTEGTISVGNSQFQNVVELSSVADGGLMSLFGPNGLENVSMGGFFDPNYGYTTVNGKLGLPNARMLATENGGMIQVFDTSFVDKVNIFAESGAGKQTFFGSNALANVQIGTFGNVDRGFVGVNNENGTGLASLSVVENGGALVVSKSNTDPGVNAFINSSNAAEVNLFDGLFRMYNTQRLLGIEANTTNGYGELQLFGGNSQAYMSIGASGIGNNNGHLFLNNSSGSTAMGLTSNDNGGVFFVSNTNSFSTIGNTFDENDRIILDISSGDLKVNSGQVGVFENNVQKAAIYTVAETGQMVLQGANGNNNVVLGTFPFFGDLNRGYVAVNGPDAAAQVYLTSNDNGGQLVVNNASNQNRAGMFINEFGQGAFYADVKNFKMDHPTEQNKEIWYASVEGPEAAAYERGTAVLENGTAFIPFSEHYQLVANAETMTVQLTPLSAESTGLAVVKKTAEGFYVKELFKGKGSYEFDWEVKCVRQGYENFQVIREKKN